MIIDLKESEPSYVNTRDFKTETKRFFDNTDISGATLYQPPSIYGDRLKPGTNVTINTGTYEDTEEAEIVKNYAKQNRFSTYGEGINTLHFKSYVGRDKNTGELVGYIPTGNQRLSAMSDKSLIQKTLDGLYLISYYNQLDSETKIALNPKNKQENTGIYLTDKQDVKDLITLQKSISEGRPLEQIGNLQVGSKIEETLNTKISKTVKGDTISISSPFLDDQDLLNNLIIARRKGVDVNVLLSPGYRNTPKSEGVQKRLTKYGINVYDSKHTLQHQKNVSIRGSQNLAVTGSSNFTDASFTNRTLDYAYVLEGKSNLQEAIEKDILDNIAKSDKVTTKYSKLDTETDYSITRRVKAVLDGEAEDPMLYLVSKMPTSLSTEFFDCYRGQSLPDLRCIKQDIKL